MSPGGPSWSSTSRIDAVPKSVVRGEYWKLSLGDERHNYGKARKAMRLKIQYEGSGRSYVESLG
jgi:hypothetical protein